MGTRGAAARPGRGIGAQPVDRRKILLVVAVVVAALGAALVFVYAQGAADRARDDVRSVKVLTATKQIDPGESANAAAKAGKLLLKEVPADQELEGASGNALDFDKEIALTTIYPGEQLTAQKFGTIDEVEGAATLPIPKGKTAITLKLSDTGRVSSFTQPGSHVAVYFAPDPDSLRAQLDGGQTGTDPQPSGGSDTVVVVPACVIESDLLVLGVGTVAVDQETPDDASGDGSGDGNADSEDTIALMTVAVDSQQASKLLGFQIASERNDRTVLAFALRNDESVVRNTQACDDYLTGLDDLLAPARSTSTGNSDG